MASTPGGGNLAGLLASPPFLLLFLLLASAPGTGRSFFLPSSRTAANGRCGAFCLGMRACRGVIAIAVGGTANTTGEGAGAARGRASSAKGVSWGERRRRFVAKETMVTNLEAFPTSRGSPTHLASTSAAASATANVPNGKAGGEIGLKHGDHRSVKEEGDGERVPTAGELLVKARDLYVEKFGCPEDVQDVCAGYAPGRVNLIGEHTDYNGGFVLPLALERGTVVFGTGRLVDSEEAEESRGWCRVVSQVMQQQVAEDGRAGVVGGVGEGEGGDVSFRADASLGPGEPEWANYVKGVVKEFMAKVPKGKCLEFTVTVVGTVPIGGGVSSSASLTVAMGTFLQGVLSSAGVSPPSQKEKAHLCRMAEHKFLDMPCGIMDQFVTSMAVQGHAMLLDCRNEEHDAVPLSDSNLVVVVTNSNVKHKLAGSQYPVRVAQCEAARDELQKSHPDIQLLRDATPGQVEAMEGRVEDTVFRRARHVVSENARTLVAAQALKDGDYGAVGRFMLDSHQSLREDYEVSCPELDVLVELAMEVEGVFGSRLTGGGFGGCTVTLVEKGSVGSLMRHLREGYMRMVGKECTSFVTKPGFGSRVLTGVDAATGTTWPE